MREYYWPLLDCCMAVLNKQPLLSFFLSLLAWNDGRWGDEKRGGRMKERCPWCIFLVYLPIGSWLQSLCKLVHDCSSVQNCPRYWPLSDSQVQKNAAAATPVQLRRTTYTLALVQRCTSWLSKWNKAYLSRYFSQWLLLTGNGMEINSGRCLLFFCLFLSTPPFSPSLPLPASASTTLPPTFLLPPLPFTQLSLHFTNKHIK